MKYDNKLFERVYDDGGAVIEGHEFRSCLFQSCSLSLTMSVPGRSIVRDVILKDCEFQNCCCGAAIVENCTVDGLKTNGLLQCFGAVFQHVVIRGRIGRLMLSPVVEPGRATADVQRRFDIANAEYNQSIDWALDIRDAEFQECELRGVPARLVRRDPETQVVIRRSSAASGTWRLLPLSDTYWPETIEQFLARGELDMVLVAPKRAKKFKKLLEGLRLLAAEGIVENR